MMRHTPNPAELAAAKRVADRYAPQTRETRRRAAEPDMTGRPNRVAVNRQHVLKAISHVEAAIKARKTAAAKAELGLLRKYMWEV